jgi:hypothetical protein
MQAHMREELTKEKKELNINSVCTFSSNSKLEYFAGKLRALWELSGSSLGALWELSGSSLGALWELSGSLSQLWVYHF